MPGDLLVVAVQTPPVVTFYSIQNLKDYLYKYLPYFVVFGKFIVWKRTNLTRAVKIPLPETLFPVLRGGQSSLEMQYYIVIVSSVQAETRTWKESM